MNAYDTTTDHAGTGRVETVEMPAATAAPMTLALGLTLVAMGCVTDWVLSGAGAVLSVLALVRWVSQLLPGHGECEHEMVPVERRARPIAPTDIPVEQRMPRLIARMQVPEKIHPYSSGLWGGLVGGAAMALVALAYGLASGRGIWYPVNLLAAMLMPSFADATDAELQQFYPAALALGLMIHVVVSAAAGLFYGVLLPTLPRWPVLWGGIVAPLLWTGAIHSAMDVLNPVMNNRVDWPWFVASQIVFGVAAGLVIVRSKMIAVRSLREGK